MTLRRASPDVLTVSGLAAASSTTSEQVASKPRPLMAEGGSAASATAARTEAAQAAQISADDCSTILPASCQTVIECRGVANRVPFSSNTPARALESPTPTRMKPCLIPTLPKNRASLPARITSVDQHHASRHQAGGIGGEEQDNGGNFVDLAHPGHRGTSDPRIVHLRVVLDECIERRGDIGWGPRALAPRRGR